MSYVYLTLLVAAFGWGQCMIGGARPAFSLPAYALIAVAGLLTVFSIRRSQARPQLACLLGTALCFSYLLVRAAYSPIPYLARADIFMMIGCLMVYLLTAFYLVAPWQRLAVVGAFLAIAVAHLGVGLLQLTEGRDFMLFDFMRKPAGTRVSGMFMNANHLAGYLESVGILGLSLVWWSSLRTWVKIVVGYLTLCCYAGLVFTGSRGGYLSAAISLSVWAVLTLIVTGLRQPRRFAQTLVIVVCALGIIGSGALWMINQHTNLERRFSNLLVPEMRSVIWEAAVDHFHLAPALGTGAGTHLYYARLLRRPWVNTDPIHAHNDYLELLAEYGIAGGVAFAIFFLVHVASGVRSLWRMARSLALAPDEGNNVIALQIGALAALAAITAHSFVDFNLHIPANALVFAFLFGILANPANALGKITGRSRASAIFRVALPLLALGSACFGFRKLPGEFWSERSRSRMEHENFPKTIENATRAIHFDRENPEAHFRLGEGYRLLGTDMEAGLERDAALQKGVDAYREGLRFFPQDENLLARLGQTFDAMGEFDAAEAEFQKAFQWDPKLYALRALYAAHQQARTAAETSSKRPPPGSPGKP